MRALSKPMRPRIKNFAILLKTNDGTKAFLAIAKHHLPYTVLPEYIRRFETKGDAEKELWNDGERVVDLRRHT